MTKPGINFTVSKFYKPFWKDYAIVINQLGYSKAINRAIKASVENNYDILMIKAFANANPEFKRRLKEQLAD